jgi:DNA repair protein RecO
MPYLRDRAIILRSESFREHDRRVVLFGMEHGLLSAVARGASAKGAKQGGHLVPFSEAEVLIAKGLAFDKLAVATVVHPARVLRQRLTGLAVAGAFTDLLERLQQPGIVDDDVYRLLQDLLASAAELPDASSAERAKLLYSAAALKLLDRIGFAPPLSGCASCREGFLPLTEQVWLLPTDGTLLCPDCFRVVRRATPNAKPVAIQTLALLRFLRRETLGSIRLLSGTSEVFRAASQVISTLLQQAPLARAPHGADTIMALVG